MTTTSEIKPADIILQQLGGSRRLSVMVGAYDFYSDNGGRTLRFRFKGCPVANLCKVTLEASDTYTVKLEKLGRMSRKTYTIPVTVAAEFDDVYAENLRGVIERATGLYLSMGTMGTMGR
ncbi:hypothetical protein UFOVP466_9 [uncultured Caudovirales phage]|uniref:Uncharacterized protein n=1 Tax=uncultured Caudovirales phage TaxID=2100421 RepID=A0A6J5T2I0_9CAUD|nr:hypothetical protein UFOVP466_9 [uncultured Caudovirales phage]CAB4180587.1 hypothetical protein UFOVP1045_56 [uncultured Caudovirales phage]CAB4189726.1 hypothetical protein UFOVP1194_10 [uncultured Caudovirales phage]CAB4221769.1 hypothetical protein UFOVP1641_6 [uncultured Caudovirales phage]